MSPYRIGILAFGLCLPEPQPAEGPQGGEDGCRELELPSEKDEI